MLTPEGAVPCTTHLGVSPHLPSNEEIHLLQDYRRTFGVVGRDLQDYRPTRMIFIFATRPKSESRNRIRIITGLTLNIRGFYRLKELYEADFQKPGIYVLKLASMG